MADLRSPSSSTPSHSPLLNLVSTNLVYEYNPDRLLSNYDRICYPWLYTSVELDALELVRRKEREDKERNKEDDEVAQRAEVDGHAAEDEGS